MGAMREIDKVGKVVDADPTYRVAAGRTLPDGQDDIAVGSGQGMTVHAGGGGRNRCVGRPFHSVVAIAAVDAQFPRVLGVAERDRLLRAIANVSGGRPPSVVKKPDKV